MKKRKYLKGEQEFVFSLMQTTIAPIVLKLNSYKEDNLKIAFECADFYRKIFTTLNRSTELNEQYRTTEEQQNEISL